MGVEPTSSDWKSEIIAVIPQPRLNWGYRTRTYNHGTKIRCLTFWLNPSLQDRCLGTVPLYGGVEPLASNGSKII